MVKQFATAARRKAHPAEWIEFEIVEPAEIEGQPPVVVQCKAIAEPSDGQVAFLMSRQSSHVRTQERVGALLNFFDSALDDETQSYISERLLDPQDEFGIDEIQDILGYLMEQWSGRPTRSSSASIPPPPPTGSNWTPPPPVSTY